MRPQYDFDSLSKEALEALQRDIPENLHRGLLRWIVEGIYPGGFLRAVLENDLRGAIGTADEASTQALPQIVRWIYSHAPYICWGSPERVEEWAHQGGAFGGLLQNPTLWYGCLTRGWHRTHLKISEGRIPEE
jgi:hypothetical protein